MLLSLGARCKSEFTQNFHAAPPLVFAGCRFYDLPELFVKIGEVVESTVQAHFAHVKISIAQKFTGIGDSDFSQVLKITLSRAGLKVTTKSSGRMIRKRGDILQTNGLQNVR